MMSRFSNIAKPQFLRFISLRMVLSVIVLTIYIFLWRPTRIFLTEQVVHSQTKIIDTTSQETNSIIEGGSLLVQYPVGDITKELHYRPQFGFFFLVALLSLLFATTNMKPYLILVGIHFVGSVLAYLFLIIGFLNFSWGFILTDAINGYLVPTLSLGLVPLVITGMIEAEKE